MSLRDPRVVKWEATLKGVFDVIDELLESKYGGEYPLHPSRPGHRRTTNREADGLFNVGAVFTAGFGSKHGRGYVVEVQMTTLARVPETVRDEIEEAVVSLLKERLPKAFPGRDLKVSRDGNVYKIHGDLGFDDL